MRTLSITTGFPKNVSFAPHLVESECRSDTGEKKKREPATGNIAQCGNTGLCRLAKTPGLDRLSSSSAYTHIRFYFDGYAFWKITAVFSGTPDTHQVDGWCPRA
jgi:hypothetical protein